MRGRSPCSHRSRRDTDHHKTERLAKVKELGDVSKSDLVRSPGSVSTKKDGTDRLNVAAFSEALHEAKGISLSHAGDSGAKREAVT